MDRENVFDIHTAALLCFALSAEMPWSPNAPLWPCAGLRRALKGEAHRGQGPAAGLTSRLVNEHTVDVLIRFEASTNQMDLGNSQVTGSFRDPLHQSLVGILGL
ncbi:unnamed protein product [Boreogadus saida]